MFNFLKKQAATEEAPELITNAPYEFKKFSGEAAVAMAIIASGSADMRVSRNGRELGVGRTRLYPGSETQIIIRFGDDVCRIPSLVADASLGNRGQVFISTESGAQYEFTVA